MPIFHLFSVSPVEVQPHELPRVLYRDFMVCAPSLEAAWSRIAEWEGVVDAAEVWGAERDYSEETYVITGPNTLMTKEAGLDHHSHWRAMQAEDGKYTHLHSGPLSIEQWQENHFAQYLARRCLLPRTPRQVLPRRQIDRKAAVCSCLCRLSPRMTITRSRQTRHNQTQQR